MVKISDELRKQAKRVRDSRVSDSLGRIAREMDEWRFERMRDLDEADFDDLGLFAERIRKLAEKEGE